VSTLGAGATSSSTLTLTIPRPRRQGHTSRWACADDLKVVAETSETNNFHAPAAPLTVTP